MVEAGDGISGHGSCGLGGLGGAGPVRLLALGCFSLAACSHDGLYTHCVGKVNAGKLALGKFVSGAYFDDPTIRNVAGGRNTYDQS